MAKQDKVQELQRKTKGKAQEELDKELEKQRGFPVPPRKAMASANKASKKLAYPLPPYPGTGLLRLFRWGQHEWKQLDKWQGLAAPVVAIVALLTWEKEQGRKQAYQFELDKVNTKRRAAHLYGAYGHSQPRQRKLFGLIPLPGHK